MKYLVVSFSFAPLNVISAQRLNSLARYLAEEGHQVEVLTAVKAPLDGPIDDLTEWNDLRQKVTIHEVPFMGRKEHDYSATFEGEQNLPNAAGISLRSRTTVKRLKNIANRFLGSLLDYRTLWAIRAVKYYRNRLADHDYDVMVTSSGPPCTNYVGARIRKMTPRLRWVADFRDMWSLLHTSGVAWPTRKIEMKLERLLLRRAERITTVSNFLAMKMQNLHFDIPVQVIRNGFEPAEFATILPEYGFFHCQGLSERINIVYAGSIYPGRRDPSSLINAVRDSGFRSMIAIHFFGSNLGGIPALVRRLSADFCFVHANRPRREILAIQKAADINLFLESGEEDAMGVLTGKLFELAGISRPVLSIGPPLHFESIRLLANSGLLLHWETLGGDLATVLDIARSAVPDQDFIASLNRKAQFNRLCRALERTHK